MSNSDYPKEYAALHLKNLEATLASFIAEIEEYERRMTICEIEYEFCEKHKDILHANDILHHHKPDKNNDWGMYVQNYKELVEGRDRDRRYHQQYVKNIKRRIDLMKQHLLHN